MAVTNEERRAIRLLEAGAKQFQNALDSWEKALEYMEENAVDPALPNVDASDEIISDGQKVLKDRAMKLIDFSQAVMYHVQDMTDSENSNQTILGQSPATPADIRRLKKELAA